VLVRVLPSANNIVAINRIEERSAAAGLGLNGSASGGGLQIRTSIEDKATGRDLHGCTSRLPVQSCVDTQFVVRRMVAEAAKQL